jgi:peroxiredoxin
MTVLLHAESVRKELGLSEEQKLAIRTPVEQAELPLWRLRDLPASERNRGARPLLDSLRAKLSTTLTPGQFERLDQLIAQASGVRAILEPRVAAALDLSDGQRHKIETALASLAHNADPAHRLVAEAGQKVLALLSERQRRTFRALMGTPFDFAAVRSIACRAPELEGVTAWINSPPLTLEQLRGKVVIVHFYTFGCINCIRNLPHYNDWHGRFERDKLAIIGMHRPETQGEREVETVRLKAAEAGLKYAIAVDNDSRNWDAWVNRVWPSVYLIDKSGFVRYWWYGELNWQGTQGEKWMRDRIAELLAEPDERESGSIGSGRR